MSIDEIKVLARKYGLKDIYTYRNKFIIPLDFEMLTVHYPITKQDSETDYVTKLRSVITTELSILQ